ncbi:MAG: hypothetical protein Tsb0014_21250 [Pleurocapsa sp.]
MNRQKILLAGAIAGLTSIALIKSVMAQIPTSDTDTVQTQSATSVKINGGGSGANSTPSPTQTPTPPDSDGAFSFGGFEFIIDSNVLSSLGFGTTGTGTGASTSTGTGTGSSGDTGTEEGGGVSRRSTIAPEGEDSDASTSAGANQEACQGELCQDETTANNPEKITINDLAELLEADLNQSLEQLAAANDAISQIEKEPRRIARRQNLDESEPCVNPAIEASKKVEGKLKQSRNFINEVNKIPSVEEGLW